VRNMIAALDTVAPKKKFKIPKVWEGKKWYSDDIRLAANKRDEAYVRAIYTSNEQDWLQFKKERNIVVKIIRRRKKEYYEMMIDDNKNDPALMWKTLKDVIRGESAGPREINDNIDFEILENVEEYTLANKFNIFYIQSIKETIESIRINDSQRTKTTYNIESKAN